MLETSQSPTVSHYGLVAPGIDGGAAFVDLFVPEFILKQLEIRPGSDVIVQGFPGMETFTFYLRARSGLESHGAGRSPFTARVRFSNAPRVLWTFLSLAKEKEVRFQAIRTFGYRAEDDAEVVFEGSIPDHQLHFVYRHNVKALLDDILGGLVDQDGKKIRATLVSHEVLRFKEHVEAGVGSTVYRLEVPVLRDRFLKIRLPLAATIPELGDDLVLARLALELDSMTVTFRTDLHRRNSYVLVFEGRDLEEAPPVTNLILEKLPQTVNVDAISAYEYLAFDPDSEDPRDLRKMGRIEMLFMTGEYDDFAPEEHIAILKEEIGGILHDAQRVNRLTITPTRDVFADLRAAFAGRREVTGEHRLQVVDVFHEALNDRYVVIGPLGDGGYGRVYKYVDLLTSKLVAGKHFPEARAGSKEVKALSRRARGERTSPHLVEFLDYFFNDRVPVIVTELLPITLANNHRCRYRNPEADPHQHPRSLREFVHMAIQICRGLEALHAEREENGGGRVAYVHGDIKPANIGAAIVDGKLVWKLIDFGLAREYENAAARSSEMGRGTPEYMSPEAVANEWCPASDIFSLGVTFFEVLCNWNHPSKTEALRPYPPEVTAYLAYEGGGNKGIEPAFDTARFKLGEPFSSEGISDAGLRGLTDIVYSMMAMSIARRIPSAEAVRRRMAEWGRDFTA